MNRNIRIAPALIAALLAFTPYAFATDDVEKSAHDMSPAATHIEADPVAEGWFGPEPKYDDKPYDAQAQLEIYSGKYLNKTSQPLQLGIRLSERVA
jgi:hypothetical protein